MITIQSAMLLALGFLTAGFIVLLAMPFYKRRAERLAVSAVKATLPMTEAEIRADKDRLRAEYAIRIHQLESKVEDADNQSARQRIELNRRDGVINQLESDLATLRISLEEHENARRVLERTITERLPQVEYRLDEARALLTERDREIARLAGDATTTAEALEEVRQINMQQKDELHRLNATLTTRQSRNRDNLADPRFDAEVALRSELEALRSRSREQAETIARLQLAATRERDAGRANGFGPPKDERQEVEIERLRSSLAEAEIALKASQSNSEAESAGHQAVQRELGTLKARNHELAGEIASLKAALAAYESAGKADAADKGDNKTVLKARIGSLEQTVQAGNVTIQSLRTELAAANERLARQASYFRDELRRLGAGTQQASAEPRNRPVAPQPQPSSARRKSLAERIGAPRPVEVETSSGGAEDRARVNAYLKALSGGAGPAAAPAAVASQGASGPQPASAGAVSAGAVSAESQTDGGRRRSSLIDRISTASKSSSGT